MLMSVNHSARSGDFKLIDIFFIFFNIKTCCVFSLELSHRSGSNECIKYTSFNIKKKITLNYPNSAALGFFQGTQNQVRNSGSKRAISGRPTEGLM